MGIFYMKLTMKTWKMAIQTEEKPGKWHFETWKTTPETPWQP